MTEMQDETADDRTGATNDDKLDGIKQQLSADVELGNADADVAAELKSRAAEAGVTVSGEDAETFSGDQGGESTE